MADTFYSLFAGYTAFWLLIAVFVIRLQMRQAKIQRELENLSASDEPSRAFTQ